MRETDLVGVHENRCNQLMGQLEHSSFKSHKYWGKRWLATKIYLDGRPLSKVLQDSETTMFDAEVLMSKATKELERLHDFGYRYGLGQSVSKDNFIVDGSGGVHLINYRSCYKLRI